jgi:DNA-binding NarL/FixJ family response regulator
VSEGDAAIRVLLVDDHAVVRRGLRGFLELLPDIRVVGEASTGEEAVEAVDRIVPDVVLMDLVMPGAGGVEATALIRRAHPSVEVVALTSFADEATVTAALEAGAAGYLMKDAEADEVADAIRSAHAGDAPLSPAIATRIVEEVAQGAVSAHDDLTPRELDVLTLIARGRSNKVIARELGVAEKTVKTHVSHILAKLGVSDRTQAALYAVKQGL